MLESIYYFTIERDGEEIEIEATAEITPGDPGKISGPPENCYPPEDPEIYTNDWKVIGEHAGLDFELTDAEEQQMLDGLLENAENLAEDARSDYEYDQWKERRDEDLRSMGR